MGEEADNLVRVPGQGPGELLSLQQVLEGGRQAPEAASRVVGGFSFVGKFKADSIGRAVAKPA